MHAPARMTSARLGCRPTIDAAPRRRATGTARSGGRFRPGRAPCPGRHSGHTAQPVLDRGDVSDGATHRRPARPAAAPARSATDRRRSRRARFDSTSGATDAGQPESLGVTSGTDFDAELLVHAPPSPKVNCVLPPPVSNTTTAPAGCESRLRGEVGEPALLRARITWIETAVRASNRFEDLRSCSGHPQARGADRHDRLHAVAFRLGHSSSAIALAVRAAASDVILRVLPRPSPRRVNSARSTIVRHVVVAVTRAKMQLDRIRAHVDHRVPRRRAFEQRPQAQRIVRVEVSAEADLCDGRDDGGRILCFDRDRAGGPPLRPNVAELRHAMADGETDSALVDPDGMQHLSRRDGLADELVERVGVPGELRRG